MWLPVLHHSGLGVPEYSPPLPYTALQLLLGSTNGMAKFLEGRADQERNWHPLTPTYSSKQVVRVCVCVLIAKSEH